MLRRQNVFHNARLCLGPLLILRSSSWYRQWSWYPDLVTSAVSRSGSGHSGGLMASAETHILHILNLTLNVLYIVMYLCCMFSLLHHHNQRMHHQNAVQKTLTFQIPTFWLVTAWWWQPAWLTIYHHLYVSTYYYRPYCVWVPPNNAASWSTFPQKTFGRR